jgi:predicted TIM-barrel enzyme
LSQTLAPLTRVFRTDKPVIGMLHLRGGTDEEKFDVACTEADQLTAAGVDAVLVEDYFGSPEVVEEVLAYLQAERPQMTYGVNILDDYERTFAAAAKYGAQFVQLDAVAGQLPADQDPAFAEQLAHLRESTGVLILGGVRFKYQPVLSGRSLAEDLALGTERCDVIVVTGPGTGMETGLDKIKEFRELVGPDFPLFVGAGVTIENAAAQLEHTDGAIVGSYFKQEHRDTEALEPAHVSALMSTIREIRAEHAGRAR